MSTYNTIFGIGTEINKISLEGLIKLINQAPKCKSEMLGDIDLKSATLEDIDNAESIRNIISECLNEITELNSFCGVTDDDGYDYILFANRAPWEYTNKELKLTRDDVVYYLSNILKDVLPDMDICDLQIANYIADEY